MNQWQQVSRNAYIYLRISLYTYTFFESYLFLVRACSALAKAHSTEMQKLEQAFASKKEALRRYVHVCFGIQDNRCHTHIRVRTCVSVMKLIAYFWYSNEWSIHVYPHAMTSRLPSQQTLRHVARQCSVPQHVTRGAGKTDWSTLVNLACETYEVFFELTTNK